MQRWTQGANGFGVGLREAGEWLRTAPGAVGIAVTSVRRDGRTVTCRRLRRLHAAMIVAVAAFFVFLFFLGEAGEARRKERGN